MLVRLLSVLLCCTAAVSLPYPKKLEVDSEESRRVLGSSVVTSVSVIMDLGNGTKKYFADAAGRPVPKPTAAVMVGSPAGLLNPDHYEFYTFDEAGDLVKRLMTLEEIQSIIANGETEVGESGFPNYYHHNLPLDSLELSPATSSTVADKVMEEAEATNIGELSSAIPGVHDVVVSVQNVLKGEIEASKNKLPLSKPVSSPPAPPLLPSSNSSVSWSIILPGIMGNSGIVSNIANQSIFSSAGTVLNTTFELGDTVTGIHSHVTKNDTLTSTQVLHNSTEASASKRPLSPLSSNILDIEQNTSNSVNIHSNLQSLYSSPTTLHVSSSLPPSSYIPSSQVLSSVAPLLATTETSSLSTLLFQFTVPSSSSKPSLPLSLTSHISVTPPSTTSQVASIMALMSQSSEISASPQQSTLPSKPLSTSTQKPQASPSNNSHFSTVEVVTNPSLIIEDNLHTKENKPLNSSESYNEKGTGSTDILSSTTAVSITKPIGTTHLSLSTFKIPSSASSIVKSESLTASAISSISQSPLSFLTESSSILSVDSERITSPQKVVGISTTNPPQTQSVTVERITKIPSTSAASAASSNSNQNIIMQYENSETLEPAMIMISSSESSNESNVAAAQEFSQMFTAGKNTSSTTAHTQFSKLTLRPSTATEYSTIIKSRPSTPVSSTTGGHIQLQTMTQTSVPSRKPTKPPQATLTTRNVTKSTTKPHSVSSSVQSSNVNPVETAKPSWTVTNNRNENLPIADLQNINVLNTKSTSTTIELPLQTTTSKNNSENLFINEASSLEPIKIVSPIGAISLPVTASGNLDVPPELAESVLGVLSQVADVEGAVTTIDYGEDSLYRLSTITEHSITDNRISTRSSSVTTANVSGLKSRTEPLHYENVMTESVNTVRHAIPNEIPAATHLNAETNKQNAVNTQSFSKAPSSQEVTNFYLKESTDGNPTTESLLLENISSVDGQETIESTTVVTGEEHAKNDLVDIDNTGMKPGVKGDDKVTEEPNKLAEKMVTLEAPKKEDNETIKQKDVSSTTVEILSSVTNNHGALKSSLGILKTEPHYEKIAISELEDTDSYVVHNVIVTTEVADEIFTGNDETKYKESTVSIVDVLTTEQPYSERNTIKNVVNGVSSGQLTDNETSAATHSEGQDITESTIKSESIILMDTTELSHLTMKENLETSTVILTKYKKDDGEMAEGSVQGNITLKPSDKFWAVKIIPDNISSFMEDASADDMQGISSESQEMTTQSEPAALENEIQNEKLNTPTLATIKNELLSTQETSIVDKPHDNIYISKTKIDTNLAEGSDLTTYVPAEDKSKEDTDYIKFFETTTESFTTELTSNFETEVTTVDEKFTTVSKDRPSFRDEESKDTTDASVMEYKISKETATPSPESKIENGFTKTPLKTGSEMNMKDVNRWDSKLTSSTGLFENETESNITKATAGNISWTKLSTLSPSQTNNNKVIDKSAAGSTRKPVTLISILSTTQAATTPAEILKVSGLNQEKLKDTKNKAQPEEFQIAQTYTTVDLEPAPHENLGLEATSVALQDDVRRFTELCNELAFRLWASITAKGLTMSRSVIMSPFAVTSLLAMVFLGARGPTSGQMNDVLHLDDMVTFNPHQVFKNVTDSLTLSRTQGIATAAIVRELYSDKTKGKLLDFYKERAQQFYDGHVEEVNFSEIGDLVRRRTNLLIKRQTHGNAPEYLRVSNILLRPPLAVFSANIFQTDCSQASAYGRDGEMYFTVIPAMRQRRLVPVPSVVWFKGFLAGYEPILDATAASIGSDISPVSLIMVLPGQQGQQAPGDGLQRLEQRLIETSYRRAAWSRLLRSLLPRPGLELQIPRFSHRSLLNVTSPLQRMGLKDLFSAEHADLRGINGLANDLHLSDIIQVNTFSTCAEESIGSRHHVEVYPTSPQRSGREEPDEDLKNVSKNFDDMDDLGISSLPLAVRPRQARLPDAPRLRFDRPFLYFVRHNPTGLILYVGRFNPRLLH